MHYFSCKKGMLQAILCDFNMEKQLGYCSRFVTLLVVTQRFSHNRSCVALFHCWFEATWTTQKELHVGYKSPNELKIGPGYISDGPKTWKIATIMTVSCSFHQLHPSLQLSPHFGRNHHSWVPGREHASTVKKYLPRSFLHFSDATSTYLFI